VLIENSIFDDVRVIDADTGKVALGAASTAAAANASPASASPANTVTPETSVDSPLSFSAEQPTLLYAGTFEKYQGIDRVIRAFAQVRKERGDVRLVLAGGTEQQVTDMRKVAAEEKLGSDVCVFTGRVSKTLALSYTAQADVLLSPRIDGTNTPLKIYEQLASGKPLVATDIWSHTQVLDNEVCFLVEPTPASIAQGMLAALEKPAEAQRRATNAVALYEAEYARPIYEKKIGRLLDMVGFDKTQ